jgi:hypothetical protein
MNKELVKCPQCNNTVKPIRKANRQSLWQKAFVPFAGYYGAFVWECPICGYRLPKNEGRDAKDEFNWQESEYQKTERIENESCKEAMGTRICRRCLYRLTKEEESEDNLKGLCRHCYKVIYG